MEEEKPKEPFLVHPNELEMFKQWLEKQDPKDLAASTKDADYIETMRLIEEMGNIPPEVMKMRCTGFGSSLRSGLSAMRR